MNEVTKRSIYLAGAFDGGLATQVVRPSRENGRFAVRVSKTSRNSNVPAKMYEQSGFLGGLFQTAHGTRWAVESEYDLHKLFEMIDPYVSVRKRELGLLWRISSLNTPIKEQEMLFQEYKKIRRLDRQGTEEGRVNR